ncbi:DUF3515 domain-containing protein [Streptomyces sp. 142MFCol3.1]|uniref:DUF3515 domain-containing protein n=1 Tax=Streptomyces sp. 142MFCol3.1 TaxID=1172179 RepID=UPI000423A129|nr:DUF3515 domain-containing protein [Streptomyces sp. 142MFCol3.1]
MNFFRHRRSAFLGLPALALLITIAGCSSADDGDSVAVPSPDTKVTELCQNLDKALPRKVDGLGRHDPEPRSALTAGWGSPAIILRCGVERPAKMTDPKVALGDDPKAVGGGVNGVDWLMEKRDDGSTRFTTAQRRAYVEVTVPEGRDTSGMLVDLAASIKKAIPKGIAD